MKINKSALIWSFLAIALIIIVYSSSNGVTEIKGDTITTGSLNASELKVENIDTLNDIDAIDMSNNLLRNVKYPEGCQDVVNKKYVEDILSGGVSPEC